MLCGLNAKKCKKKTIALYLILKIWSQKLGVSSFHFRSVYKIDFTDQPFCNDLFGKRHNRDALTLSQTTNFRLFQTERACRCQFQI